MLLQAVNFTSYRLIRKTLVYCVSLTMQLSYIFISVNDNVFVLGASKVTQERQETQAYSPPVLVKREGEIVSKMHIAWFLTEAIH